MEITQDFLKSIRPVHKGRSDKYSINLYRFLLKYKGWSVRVLACPYSRFDHSYQPIDWSNPRMGDFFLNIYPSWDKQDDGFHTGRSLNEVLLGGPHYKEIFSYIPSEHHDWRYDVSDWFWKTYRGIGRATWDMQGKLSMQDDECRWTYLDKNTRRCNWTGLVQYLHKYEVRTIESKERWAA